MVMLVASVLFLILSTARLIRFGPTTYDSLSSGIESIFLIIFCIFYLFEQISKPDHIFFYAVPEFWVIVALLLYFSGTFFLSTAAQSILTEKKYEDQYKLITFAFEIIKSLLLGVAMLVKGGDKKNTFTRIDYSSLDEHLNLNR